MTDADVLRRFWITVFIAVIALGIAWGNWKAQTQSVMSVTVALVATLAFAGAMLVASRFVVVHAHASRRAVRGGPNAEFPQHE